jgi:hypothetical protein
MAKSKRELAFARLRFMDPGWHTGVIPVAGEGGWAVCARRNDRYTGRTLYGQVFATYTHRLRAEHLSDELNAEHQRRMVLRCQAMT